MTHDWFIWLLRASVLMLLSGMCVALLSRFYPASNARWHRMAWGAVLLQGILVVPFSLTIETPAWLASSFTGRYDSEPSTADDAQIHSTATASESSRMHLPQAADATTSRSSPKIAEYSSNQIVSDRSQSLGAQVALSQPSVEKNSSLMLETQAPNVVPLPELAATGYSENAERTWTNQWWFNWLVAMWLCGVAALVGIAVMRYVCFLLALAKTEPAKRSWVKELRDLSLELKLDRAIALDVHASIGPIICWTPRGYRIVVPVELWSELSSSERIAVLHHELSHLRRGDLWKSLLARLILSLHWFNPLAWLSARRFDEAAEWACDALLAREQPARATQLANALLAATSVREDASVLSLSVTGGPLFQRIRRLVSWDQQRDSVALRCVWTGILCPLMLLGLFQLKFADSISAQVIAQTTLDEPQSSNESASPTSEDTAQSLELDELANRILVGDNDKLKRVVALMKTPVGQIVMADRAAVHAQGVSDESGDVSPWRRFIAEHFVTKGQTVTLNDKYRAKFDKFVSQQKDAEAAVKLIGPVLREVAAELNTSTETGQFLQRFLNHDGAAAYLYTHELRGRLHPQVSDLGEAFSQIFVRNAEGVFVIRPARSKAVELRLANIETFQPLLKPFHEELKEWSSDLADRDERHRKLKATLADPHFALFLSGQQIAQFLADRGMMASSAPNDAQFEDYFYRLEEATNDAPAGLVLNTDSEALQELEHEVARFAAVQQNRETLERPRRELIEQLKQGDELHDKLKTHLKTELAFMIMIQEMDYSPISANGAAREWLANLVTKGTDGKYTINEEAKDEVLSRCQDFFQQFREFRRRGRMVVEFARGLQDRTLAASFQTMTGKLLLQDLVEGSSKRSDVDGLQVWVNTFFEETSDGLRLLESAEGELDTILSEAGELESQLSKNDF